MLASRKIRTRAHVEPADGMAITAEPLDDEEAPLSVLTADTHAAIDQLRADARAAAEASRAPSSERAYAADWRDFCAFAARIGRARLGVWGAMERKRHLRPDRPRRPSRVSGHMIGC
jgi:hypothetical protein